MKRTLATWSLVAAFALAVMLMRVLWDGRQALVAADEAMARGEISEAITWWRRAARWYAPGAPHVRAAYQRLIELAEAAEESGDTEVALEAWRAVRSSSLSTRSVYTPFPAELERANARIAELMTRLDPGPDPAQRKAWHAKLLARDDSPAIGWTLVALLGFAVWVGGGFLFARRGFGEGDRLERRPALRSAALVAIGLAMWMVGLALA